VTPERLAADQSPAPVASRPAEQLRRPGAEAIVPSPEGSSGREAKASPESKAPPENKASHETKPVAPPTPAERRADVPAEPAVSAPEASRAAEPAPLASPPALPAAALRQIADAVTSGASSLPDGSAVRAGAVAAAWSAAAQAEGPVRLLTLQLRPAELGQVLVRMRLQDGRLEMSLRAAREETAELLRRDGGLLTALVRDAGYQPDLVTIQSGPLPGQRASGQPEVPQGGGQTFQAFAGGQQQGGASPDQPARRTPDAPEEGGRRTMEQRDEAHPGDRDRGGLYL